jgi:leader peptidase (prepilin peptidase) / N-methyltransferase
MLELAIISSLIGLSLGSFVNVCAYRLPRGLSIVSVRSFCPHCQRKLGWFELVPVLSFVIAYGKCKGCGERISFLYPIIELLVAGVAVFAFQQNSISIKAFELLIFTLFMLIVALIDWKHLVIPNQIVIVGLITGFLIKGLLGKTALIDGSLALILSLLTLLVVKLLGNYFLKRQSMGMGDVKLAAVIGLFLGYQHFLIALWLAAIVGTVYGLIRRRKGISKFAINNPKFPIDSKLPFGSFLSGASVFVFFFQQQIQGLMDAWLIWNL